MIKVKVPAKFRRNVVLRRYPGGAYVDGHYVNGAPVDTKISASLQPVSPSDYRLFEEGASPQLAKEVFFNGLFSMGIDGKTPDEIIDGTVYYRCMFIKSWEANGYNSAIFITTEENPYS